MPTAPPMATSSRAHSGGKLPCGRSTGALFSVRQEECRELRLALAALRAWLQRLVPSICLAIATRQRGRNDMARKIGSQRRFGRDRGKGTGVLDVTVLDAAVLCVAVWVGSVVDGGASKAPDGASTPQWANVGCNSNERAAGEFGRVPVNISVAS
jgi:ABC-type Fe3+ transport system permease subunit